MHERLPISKSASLYVSAALGLRLLGPWGTGCVKRRLADPGVAVSLASARISIPASRARRKGMNPEAIQSLSMIAYLVPLIGTEAGG